MSNRRPDFEAECVKSVISCIAWTLKTRKKIHPYQHVGAGAGQNKINTEKNYRSVNWRISLLIHFDLTEG